MTEMMLWFWRLPLPGWLRVFLMTLVNPRFVVTASAVVLNERGEVLLFKHTYRVGEPWGLPGGFLKRNEDPGEAVGREIMEESGLDVCVEQPLWVGRDPNFQCVNIIYTARLRSGSFAPSAEVCEARFFSTQDLPDLSPGPRRFISMARALQGDQPPVRSG